MQESNIQGGALLERLLSTAVSQAIDPSPVRLADRDAVRGRVIAVSCSRDVGGILQLRPPIPRNAFLAGCFELTHGQSREHLVVGFGIRRADSTLVARLVHSVGNAGNVAVPIALQAEIKDYVLSGHAHEVLIFHNHPQNQVNALCDNEPWASPPDRAVAMRYVCDPRMLLKAITQGGRIRFYLGENGYVREFIAPDAFTLLEGMTRAR